MILYWYYSAHVMFFIVSLISFASFIITNYMDDVRLSHLNKDYLLTYLLNYLQEVVDDLSSGIKIGDFE